MKSKMVRKVWIFRTVPSVPKKIRRFLVKINARHNPQFPFGRNVIGGVGEF